MTTMLHPLLPLRFSTPLLLLLTITLLLTLTSTFTTSQQVILPESQKTIQPVVWPQPHSVTLNKEVPNGGPILFADPDAFTVTWEEDCADRDPLLTQATLVSQKLFPVTAQPKKDAQLKSLVGLTIRVVAPLANFDIASNSQQTESYNLTVSYDSNGDGTVHLYAPTPSGAIYGIETLSQLLTFEYGNYLMYNSSITIYDIPRFPYRGIALDTSHHFIDVPTLHHIIEGMSMNKFNVLHWIHRSAVAISIQSNVYPDLTSTNPDQDPLTTIPNDEEGGSFDSVQGVYTQAVVYSLIQFARVRGVHVIIEQGGLENAASIGYSHSELISCQEFLGTPYPDYLPVALDPTINATYEFLQNYWSELDESSTDFVHLGGDRLLDYSCWKTSTNITEFMQKHHLDSYTSLQAYFIERIWSQMMVTHGPDSSTPLFTHNQRMMYRIDSQEPAVFPFQSASTFPNTTGWDQIVWEAKDQDALRNITELEFDVIYSGQAWDLTSSLNSMKRPASNPLLSDIYDDWMSIYEYDIIDGVEGEKHRAAVLGGEVQVWTKQQTSETIQQTLWPRASAAAERLWSPENFTSTGTTTSFTLYRLQSFICTLHRHNIHGSALRPGYCSANLRVRRQPTKNDTITMTWVAFGFLIAFSVIGGLYTLSVILSMISHLRAGTKKAVSKSLNAPLMSEKEG